MKRLSTAIFLLIVNLTAHAQIVPEPGTERYQELKANGQLNQLAPFPKQKSYPVLRDATNYGTTTDTASGQMSRGMLSVQQTFQCEIEDSRIDPSFQTLPVNDDESSPAIPLNFNFNFFGNNYGQVYVNNNGNITFDAPNTVYTSTGFPSSFDMVAPFWADVDTRVGSGRVYYKSEATRFTVIWYKVGYYNQKIDKLNTFKVVITNGADPIIGAGNNVAFYYGDMQWTTGDASGSSNGFYGMPATVGVNNGQGQDACFYYQIGRFGKPGSEYIDAFEASGIDYLDHRCFTFDASVIEDVHVDFRWQNLLCAVDFSIIIDNPQNCLLYYQWNFGDGTTSLESNPLHSYSSPGTYQVKLNVYYQCGACHGNIQTIQKQIVMDPAENLLMDTLIEVASEIKPKALSTTASTFSDTWPLQHEAQSLSNQSGYFNGSQGVWRRQDDYGYQMERQRSPVLSLSTDGTFELEQFNWQHASLEAIPNWIKANSVTVYSPFSNELENKNLLDVYSAALYDYGGYLPTANGVNMRNNEMAYTGFEYLEGKASGNWIFGNQPIPGYRWFETHYSYKNIAVVKASLAELEGYNLADVYGRNYFFFAGFPFFYYRYIRDNEIICSQQHPSHPGWSVLVLKRALFNGYWKGHVMFRNQVVPIISPDIDNTVAHTGKSSLKVTSNKTFNQTLLRLDSAKSYYLCAWVSVNDDVDQNVPELAQNLGIDVKVKDQDGIEIGNFSFVPSGNIIEGWQQVYGTFICPVTNPVLELTFKPGSKGTAWYDDLRLHPEKGNMRSYVYNLVDYRLQAILDEENFASFFYYDAEGNLYLTKKETEDGIKTLTENISYTVER